MASDLQRNRRRVGFVLILGPVLVVSWFALPGLPVMWAPRASAKMKALGKALFEHEWTVNDPLAGGDGLGPVFNARSCLACHFQGGAGGGGPNQHNVVAFEVLATRAPSHVQAGLIHHFAVDKSFQESFEVARKLFPIAPLASRVVGSCGMVTLVDFDPLRTESINSTALFGAGWIDRISARSITHQHLLQGFQDLKNNFALDFRAVPAGRPRILADGRVGKFGWRGQFATLKEFVAAACANELGLGNPLMEQAKPLGRPDYPVAKPDLNRSQFDALVAFVDTLPRPIEDVPLRGPGRSAAIRGKELFHTIGCVICHVPDLGGVTGIYSDFLLHNLEDLQGPGGGYGNQGPPPVPPPDGYPQPSEWKTPPLWGVADSAPYFHDGSAATLEQAILRHRGDATRVTKAYLALPPPDQQAVISFLKTLKAPPATD